MTTTPQHPHPTELHYAPGTLLAPHDLDEGVVAAIANEHDEHALVPFVVEAALDSGNVRVRWPDGGLTTFDPADFTIVAA